MQTITSTEIQTEIDAVKIRVQELAVSQTEIEREIAESPSPDLISLQNQHAQNLFALRAAQTRLDHLQAQYGAASRGESLARMEGMLNAHFQGQMELDALDIEILKARQKVNALVKIQSAKKFDLDTIHRKALDLAAKDSLAPESKALLALYSHIPLNYPAAQRLEILKSRVERGAMPDCFDFDEDTKRHQAYIKLTKG